MPVLSIIPTKSANNIAFGSSRATVEASFGQPRRVFKKTKWSKGETADYGDFHIHFDENDCFEAIEIFEAKVELPDGTTTIPANEEVILKAIPSIKADEYGLTSTSESIGASVEDGTVTSILFGRSGYYA